MEIDGEQSIHASQWDVWNALNDPGTLKACLPNCEVLDRLSEHEFRVEMLAVVGPVKARFKGTLKLSDIDAPNRYVLSFEGSGGASGFAKGSARVSLAPDTDATRLVYQASAHVGGKLAQIGSRLVGGAAKRTTDDFFARFNARFEADAAAPASQESDTAASPASTVAAAAVTPRASADTEGAEPRPPAAQPMQDEPSPAALQENTYPQPARRRGRRSKARPIRKRLRPTARWVMAGVAMLVLLAWILYVLK